MIVGVGVDIVEIDRVGRLVDIYGDRFLQRVFTPDEIQYAARQRERLAGRFAAKEAILKVLKTGLSGGISWKEIRISSEKGGAPRVDLAGRAEAQAESLHIREIHLSISHDMGRAVAFAVGEGG